MERKLSVVEVVVLPDGRLDTKNAARFLGLGDGTLAVMRSLGKGPRYIKRGKVYYYLEELERWIRDGDMGDVASPKGEEAA
jgi:hypothetical protein